MIIGLLDQCEIGDVVEGEYERNEKEYYKIVVKIMRTATKQEWIEYRTGQGLFIPSDNGKFGYYYEVHTD